EPSKLGLVREDQSFTDKLKLVSVSKPEKVIDEYQLAVSKKFDNKYAANKIVLRLTNANQAVIEVIFQVSNDGVAFRYHFPEKSDDLKTISKEITSFKFSPSAKAWLQPMSVAKTGWSQTNPSYEEF